MAELSPLPDQSNFRFLEITEHRASTHRLPGHEVSSSQASGRAQARDMLRDLPSVKPQSSSLTPRRFKPVERNLEFKTNKNNRLKVKRQLKIRE